MLPAVTDADLVAAIERAGRHCLSFGITSVMDAAVGSKAGFREIAAYRTARATGRLPVRVNQCLLGGPGGIVDRAYAEGLVTGAGDDRLSVGPVKIFTDGSAGARTAAMSAPYLGEPANQGLLCLAPQELSALVRDYHARGYQLAIHAIGDRAIDQVLDAYGLALDDAADADRRHRIEHCSFVRPDQIARMAGLGVHPVPQPVFIHEYGELYMAVVGAERTAASHPMRSWIEAGLRPAASTDGPVSGIEPFPNLYAMLARRSSAGTLLGAAQALTMPEALAAYTAHGAYVNRAERHRGRLMPGFAADVAVFSRDLLAASPEEVLEDTLCDLTLLGGEIVHDRLGEAGARGAAPAPRACRHRGARPPGSWRAVGIRRPGTHMAGAALPSRPLEPPMSKPLVVSIPHQLGKDEAIRRLKGGLGHLKEKTDGKLAAVEDSWSDNRADFRLAVLGQTASGKLEVLEDSVRLEVQLPWLLAMVAEKVRPLIEKQGHLMLEKK